MNKKGKGLFVVLIIIGILLVISLFYLGITLTGNTIVKKDRTQEFQDRYEDYLEDLYTNYKRDLSSCSVSILNTISEKCENSIRNRNSLGSKTEWRGDIQSRLGSFTNEEFNEYVNTYAVKNTEIKLQRSFDCIDNCVVLKTIRVKCLNECLY